MEKKNITCIIQCNKHSNDTMKIDVSFFLQAEYHGMKKKL